MNWFIVAEHDLSQPGAVQTHVIEFCTALSKLTNIALISYTEDEFFQNKGLNFKTFSCKPIKLRLRNIGYLLSTIKLFIHLNKLRNTLHPDIIYTRAAGFGLGSLFFAKLIRVPCFVEINGNWREEQKLSIKNYSIIKRIIVKPVLYIRHLSLLLMCHLATKLVVVTHRQEVERPEEARDGQILQE